MSVTALGDTAEGGSTNKFRVTRDVTSGVVSVNFSLGGTAVQGFDYSADSLFAYFGEGVGTVDVTITPTDDGSVEGTETIQMTLSSGWGYTLGTSTATMNLFDNDTVQVTVAKQGSDPTEGGNGTFRITRTGSTSGNLTVNFATGGTATSGTDYTSIGTSATITNGNSYVDVTVTTLADNVVELGNESVSILITDGGSTYSAYGSSAFVAMAIIDDPAVISVSAISDTFESKADGKVRFTRSGGNLADPLTVTYSSSGSANSGSDYTTLPGAVTFASGVATADVSVSALSDLHEESDETVTLALSGTGTAYLGSASASVKIYDTTVLPVAVDGWLTTDENTEVEISILDLVYNPNDYALSIVSVTQGSNGATSGTETVTYTPATGFVGEDAFTYTVEDDDSNQYSATVTITVDGMNAPPFSVWTSTNTAVNIDAASAGFDVDGDSLTVTAVTQGSHGTVAIEGDGTVTYTPDTSYSGDDSFTYTLEDADENEGTSTITITVSSSEPVAVDTSVSTEEDMDVIVTVLDLAFNPAGGTLSVSAVTQPDHGSVTINVDGTVTYTPSTSYSGDDSFTFTVMDGSSNTSIGAVSVTVGDPSPKTVDDVEQSFSEIEEELEAPDEDSPSALSSLWGVSVAGIADYLDEVAGIVSSANSLVSATNVPFENSIRGLIRAYHIDRYNSLDNAYETMTYVEQLLKSLVLAQKQLTDSIWDQWLLAFTNNNFAAGAYLQAHRAMNATLIGMINAYSAVARQNRELYVKTAETYFAVREALLATGMPVAKVEVQIGTGPTAPNPLSINLAYLRQFYAK